MRRKRSGRAIGMLAAAGLGLVLSGSGSPAHAQEDEEGEVRRHRHVEVRPHAMARAWSGGYLGVRLEDVDEEDVRELGLPEEGGAKVVDVAEDTPAEEAGLEDGDVIVAWNGSPLASVAQLQRHVRETPPGRTVRLEVRRDGASREIQVRLGERSEAMAFRFAPGGEWHGGLQERMGDLREHLRGFEPGALPRRGGPMMMFFGRSRMGVGLQSLGEQLGEYFGLGERTGALVTHVEEDSPAAAAGLRAGDVILSIGGRDVADPRDAGRIVRRAEAGPVEVRILRDGSERTVTVELEEREEGEGRAPDPSAAPGPRVHVAPFEVRLDGEVDGLLRALDLAPLSGPALHLLPGPLPEVDVYY